MALEHEPVDLEELSDSSFAEFPDLVQELAHLWEPAPDINFVDWMDTHFRTSDTSSAAAGPWTTRPYQRGIAFAMADPRIRTFALQMGSQKGKSKIALGYMGYSVSHLRRNVMCFQPNGNKAREFSNVHFADMVRDVRAVGEKLRAGSVDKIGRDNTSRCRIFEAGIAYIVPATSGSEFRMSTADDVIVDDADGAKRSVRGANTLEGSIRVKAEGRTNASSRPKNIYISTPTEHGKSVIEDIGGSIAERFDRELPCPYPDCGKHFVFDMPALHAIHLPPESRAESTGDTGLLWSSDPGLSREERAASCFYRCPHCRGEFDYESFGWMEQHGRWASDRYIQTDQNEWYRRDTGEACDPPREVFHRAHGLISYEKPWSELVDQFLRAQTALDRGDNGDMVGFFNETLGLIYHPATAVEIEIGELLGRLEDYPVQPLHERIQRVTCAIDVQGAGYYQWEIKGFGPGRENWSIDTGQIIGDPTNKHCPSWDELDELVAQQWVREDGRQMIVDLTFCDAGWMPQPVKHWCARAPRTRMASQGQGSRFRHLVRIKAPERNDIRCFVAQIGVHQAAEMLYRMLAITRPKDAAPDAPVYGLCHFPRRDGYYEIDEDGVIGSSFFQQLTADRRVEKRTENGIEWVYENVDEIRNEAHDLGRMHLAAIETIETFFRRPLTEPDPSSIADAQTLAMMREIEQGQ